MEPWEEKWQHAEGTAEVRIGPSPIFRCGNFDDPEEVARAKLAAQAPAMARLLLKSVHEPEVEAVLRAGGVIE